MEKFLRRCLDSLIIDEDGMKQLEVLVINDGSKDSSSQIAHEYQDKYPETFRVIDKENGNYGSCINRGLKEAKGKYVKVLDADDWFDNGHFRGFVSFLDSCNVDCIINNMVTVYEQNSKRKVVSYKLPHDRIFGLGELNDAACNMWMHCVCYLTSNVRRIDYHQTEGISYTDQEWICLPMSNCNKLFYYNKIIYNYCIGRDGQTISPVIWNKNFWMEIDGLFKMIQQRRALYEGCTQNGADYIDKRIKARTLSCYYAYFLQFSDNTNDHLMKKLDEKIREYDIQLYAYIGSLSLFKLYKYVSIWRKQNKINRPFLSFLVRFRAMIKTLISY